MCTVHECFFKGSWKLFAVHKDVWAGLKMGRTYVNLTELEKLLSSVPIHCFTSRPQYWHYVKILSRRDSLCKIFVRCCPPADTVISGHLSTPQYTHKITEIKSSCAHLPSCTKRLYSAGWNTGLCPILPPILRQAFGLQTPMISQWIVQLKGLIHKDTWSNVKKGVGKTRSHPFEEKSLYNNSFQV